MLNLVVREVTVSRYLYWVIYLVMGCFVVTDRTRETIIINNTNNDIVY
jgi:hypothetical protein